MRNETKLKNQRGFTLVEVIVVAIIVAALAGVAIPMYTSYVESSRTNAAANAAGSVASFMGSCLNQSGAVTGIDAGSETEPTAEVPVNLVCETGTGEGKKTLSSMQLPPKIKFTVSKTTNDVEEGEEPVAGVVTAKHVDGKEAQSYNF